MMQGTNSEKISNSENLSNESPFFIYCKDCGSPADYNIKTGNYNCPSCGSNTELSVSLKQFRERREEQRKKIIDELKVYPNISYTCPNCSATVLIMESEANATCSFCGSQIVRNSYLDQDKMPEVIIPFKITIEESKKILKDWLEKNSEIPEAKKIQKNINNIRAFYLPYEMIRGPISCTVKRDNSFRSFTCGGYVDGMVVNSSKEFNNELLDNIEPFNWIDARPFNFSYLAGTVTKIRDLQDQEIHERTQAEVCSEYRTEVNKVLQNSGTRINTDLKDTCTAPTLMPVYVVGDKKAVAMINGQTGRLALKRIKPKTENIWYIRPTILTLLIMIITYLSIPDMQLVIMLGLVAGMICFAICGQGKSVIKRNVYLNNGIIDAIRHSPNKIEYVCGKNNQLHKIQEPVFFEPINGKMKPVILKFNSFGRILKWVIGTAIVIGFPNILAILIALACDIPLSDLRHGYGAAWYTLTIPCSFILYLSYGMQGVYDSPEIFEILSDGKLKKYKPNNKKANEEKFENIHDKIENQKTEPIFITNVRKLIKDNGALKVGCLTVGFILFMLLGTVGAIFPNQDSNSKQESIENSQQQDKAQQK